MTSAPVSSDQSPPNDEQERLFEELEAYNWSSDAEFQSGLQAILGPSPSDPAQAEHLTLRARCFYFSRKRGAPIDFNAYKAWHSRQPIPSSNLPVETLGGAAPAGPYPTSFNEIIQLISSGQPIPGIKEVPDTVLEGKASQPGRATRKKPWESRDTGEDDSAA